MIRITSTTIGAFKNQGFKYTYEHTRALGSAPQVLVLLLAITYIHRPQVSWLPYSRLAHTGDIVMQQWPMCTKHGNSKYYKVL